MKITHSLRRSFYMLLCALPIVSGEVIIPGGGGPHANKDFVFNGNVQVWANELYNYDDGQAVIFDGAGEVMIDGPVLPKSMLVRGEGDSTLGGLGQISGETSLTKEGSGTMSMNSINSYSGGTLLKEGILKAGGDASFGSGAIVVEGGQLNLGDYAVNNDIYFKGGALEKAGCFCGRLLVEEDMVVSSRTSARKLHISPGKGIRISAGVELSSDEELELHSHSMLDLSGGGAFKGNLKINSDGVLHLPTNGTAAISAGCTWHLNNATVSGNLATAGQAAARALSTSSSGASQLRISGTNSLSAALTLNGGTLILSDASSTLQVGTLVLSSPTTLQQEQPAAIGKSQTFLRYNRLLSGAVTDYYDFFGIDAADYELTVTSGSITITTLEPTTPEPAPPIPPVSPDTPPNEQPEKPINPEGPVIDTPEQTPPSDKEELPGENDGSDGPHDSKDPGPIIDTSGNNSNDPHQNKGESAGEGSSDSAEQEGLSAEAGSALSQAGMQSAWGAALASDIFMQTIHDQSRSGIVGTWLAFMGGITETDSGNSLPGGDCSAYGVAIGADAAASDSTRLGIAVGGSIGTVSGDSFGELDQTTLQAAVYMHHAFLPADSDQQIGLYLAFGGGRTETDPGAYSGYENWHHNSIIANSRLNWALKLSDCLSWNLYGGVDYYSSGDTTAGEEEIRVLSYTRGRIGSGIVCQAKDTILYAEAEFNGDMMRDTPTAMRKGFEFHTAEPDRCGFALHVGLLLRPQESERTIGLHYSFESRGDTSAHVINMSFDRIF
ncbi:MAG: autotransporter domain-containing protein [Akkermansia sp.]|nr:autotransporter domain-containing protein [Akkermansia sp.]